MSRQQQQQPALRQKDEQEPANIHDDVCTCNYTYIQNLTQGYISLVLYITCIVPSSWLPVTALFQKLDSLTQELSILTLPLLNHIHITLTIATTTDHLLACKVLVAKIVIMIVFTRISTCLYTTGSSGYHSILLASITNGSCEAFDPTAESLVMHYNYGKARN